MIKLYTVQETAEILRASPYTIRQWCRTGELEAVQRHPGSAWLIPEKAIEAWIKRNTYTL